MELYKVVRKTERGYTSCIVNAEARVVYSTEQPTEPEFGWLFVFDSLYAARSFIMLNFLRGVRVFTVSATETLAPTSNVIPVGNAPPTVLRDFWAQPAAWALRGDTTRLPPRTLFARGVTLLEEVPSHVWKNAAWQAPNI